MTAISSIVKLAVLAAICTLTASIPTTPMTLQNTPTPSHNTPTPSHNTTTPSYNTGTPSHNTETPSHNTPTPSHNTPTPSHNTPTPSPSTAAPPPTAPGGCPTAAPSPTPQWRCGGSVTLTAASGYLSSQHAQYDYPTDADCLWVVAAPPGKVVRVEFLRLGLDPAGASVKLFDGQNKTSRLLATVTGDYLDLSLLKFQSSGNFLTVHFESDSSSTRSVNRGFFIHYVTDTRPSTFVCQGGAAVQSIHNSSGVISSHTGVGTCKYNNNLNCRWHVTVPAGMVMSVWFTHVDLEANYDFVRVIDGAGKQVANVSGTHAPSLVTTTTSSNFINFTTDWTENRTGFILHFSAVPDTVPSAPRQCTAVTAVTEDRGNISSHEQHGVKPYGGGMGCDWNITAPQGKVVSVTVELVNVNPAKAQLRLLDGPTRSHSQLADLLSAGAGSRFVSTARHLLVASDVPTEGAAGYKGFAMTYQFIDDPSPGSCSSADLTADEGTVKSHPGAGSYNYDYGLRCVWRITVAEGKVVKLQFPALRLADDSRLSIYKGLGEDETKLLRTAKNTLQGKELESFERSVTIVFESAIHRATGFIVDFKAVQQPESHCSGEKTLTAAEGTIVSHGNFGKTNYQNNARCVWILAPQGKVRKIQFNVSYLDLESPGDTLSVLGGPSQSRTLTGSSGPQTWEMSYYVATVEFTSNAFAPRTGFHLSYSASEDNVMDMCKRDSQFESPSSSEEEGFFGGPRERDYIYRYDLDRVCKFTIHLPSKYNYPGATRPKSLKLQFYDMDLAKDKNYISVWAVGSVTELDSLHLVRKITHADGPTVDVIADLPAAEIDHWTWEIFFTAEGGTRDHQKFTAHFEYVH